MIADPLHEILVLVALVVGYTVLVALVWFILCGANAAAMRAFNAAIAAHESAAPAQGDMARPSAPDLETILSSLLAEQHLSLDLAARLRRITPVFHKGKWVAYPSSAYWAYRFERLKLRSAGRQDIR